MSRDKIIIETRETRTLGCGHAIRSFFRGIIALTLTVGAILVILFALIFA